MNFPKAALNKSESSAIGLSLPLSPPRFPKAHQSPRRLVQRFPKKFLVSFFILSDFSSTSANLPSPGGLEKSGSKIDALKKGILFQITIFLRGLFKMMYSIYQNHTPDSRYVKKAPWYPPYGIDKMLSVLEEFDPRITIDSSFMYDLDLAKSLAKSIIDNENEILKKKFISLYCGLVDAYNRAATKFNKEAMKK